MVVAAGDLRLAAGANGGSAETLRKRLCVERSEVITAARTRKTRKKGLEKEGGIAGQRSAHAIASLPALCADR